MPVQADVQTGKPSFFCTRRVAGLLNFRRLRMGVLKECGVAGQDTITVNGRQIPATHEGVKQSVLNALKSR